MVSSSFITVLALLLFGAINFTQAQNFVPNGDFQSVQAQDDLWDGVDGDGYLCNPVRSLTALNDLNRIGEVTIPPSVAIGDMNGDGIPDLVTADTFGYYRVYFNSGTKTQPKFTQGELMPFFLNRDTGNESEHRGVSFSAPRIDLFDTSGRGSLDMVTGFYGGALMILPNTGSRTVPAFTQPRNFSNGLIRTSSQDRIWANLMAPTVIDWNRDGKIDVLVGDGSYSANAVFLLTNQGSSSQPKFSEESRSYLVYGNGRTQLCPTVVDYNGDGLPDVITSDRKGDVQVNLNEPGLKPGVPLMKSSVITFGGVPSLHTSVTVKAADLNGDGLFDLVFGKANGRIAVAYNTGTKEQPQFGAPQELQGVDLYKHDVMLPTGGCTTDSGFYKGNFNGRLSIVSPQSDPNAQSPSGKNCLRISYDAPFNKLMPLVPADNSSQNRPDHLDGLFFWGGGGDSAETVNSPWPVRSFAIQFTLKDGIIPGIAYQLSFNVKGRGAVGRTAIGLMASGKLAEGKITRGERGAASVSGGKNLSEHDTQPGTFSVGPQWSTISKTITFHFKKNELNNPKAWKGVAPIRYYGSLILEMEIEPFEGNCYVDNVQLLAK